MSKSGTFYIQSDAKKKSWNWIIPVCLKVFLSPGKKPREIQFHKKKFPPHSRFWHTPPFSISKCFPPKCWILASQKIAFFWRFLTHCATIKVYRRCHRFVRTWSASWMPDGSTLKKHFFAIAKRISTFCTPSTSRMKMIIVTSL